MFHTVTVTEDQQGLTADGSRYVAQPGESDGSCKGCAFRIGYGCPVWDYVHRDEGLASAHCRPRDRRDERHIVWVSVAQAK